MELILESLRIKRRRKMSEEEIPAEKLAAYLENRLNDNERAMVEARLARDPDARAEMIATARLVGEIDSGADRGRSWWKPAGIAVAAAAILILAVLPRDRSRATSDVPMERESAIEDGGRIVLISPAVNQTVDRNRLRFLWRAEETASYRLTLADSTGNMFWTGTTASSGSTLPDSVRLSANSRYYWYVDAIRIDGSSITSGPREFRTTAK
ncbi:MAG TPA: hypothetical protein VM939_12235 [Gemmatimonadaceae bacterium]|nr:hypothetical protein [Gemmatimonadaceae bacterium]